MKSKLYIGIISLLLITGSTLKAQKYDILHSRNDEAKVIVNNYFGDYDYFFSSRINRFHRSYAIFDYYAPVFTDTYWYNYQPFSWGISIYDGDFGIEYANIYPVYNYDYRFNNGWYDPYYDSFYYRGFSPLYYNSWYLPVVINLNSGFGSHYHYYRYSYNSHNDNYHNNYYNNYYNNNYYRSERYSYVNDLSSRRSRNNSGLSAANGIRRERPSVGSTRNESFDRNPERSDNVLQRNETIRNSIPAATRDLGQNNTGNSGNINYYGVDRNRRSVINNVSNISNTRNANLEVNKSRNQNMNNVRSNGGIIDGSERRSSVPSNVKVNSAVEQQSLVRRSFNAGSGSVSDQNRTMNDPVKRFSSSGSRNSGSQGGTISSKSESQSGALTRSSSSSTKEKSGKRR